MFFSKFQQNTLKANSEDFDQTEHYAVSDLGLHCLHMPHEKDATLIWVMSFFA